MIEYAPPGLADVPALAAMARESFVATFGTLYTPANLDHFLTRVLSEAALGAEVADPAFTFRIARDAGRIAGFVKLGPRGIPIAVDDAIELRQLYVLAEWQGSGVAATLMDWALGEARARAAKAVLLTVYTDNIRAQRFYQRYGFRDVGRYDFPVGDQIDEDRIYRLDL
jgi:ribosomal protein S18 acetylase RimI-like enzyme